MTSYLLNRFTVPHGAGASTNIHGNQRWVFALTAAIAIRHPLRKLGWSVEPLNTIWQGERMQNALPEPLALPGRKKQMKGLSHTLQEICQQPTTWRGTVNTMCASRASPCDYLEEIGIGRGSEDIPSVLLVGAGTSDFTWGERVRFKLLSLLMVCGYILHADAKAPARESEHTFAAQGDHFALEGKPFQAISGEMQ
jgi:hypothetical protein